MIIEPGMMSKPVIRYAVGVEYDGTDYHGWQRQNQLPSLQAEIEHAISQVADETIEVVCAGRTDKGVHAFQQVIHFDTIAKRETHAWIRGVNRYLSPNMGIRWIQAVPPDFHARFSATARRYAYVLYCHSTRPVIMRRHVTHEYKKLDLAAMRLAATYLLGKHDFSSFRGADCQAKTTIRTILHLNLVEKAPFLIIDIKANAFLHHMVRNITGSLLAVAHKKYPPEWIKEVLTAKNRSAADMTAPAQGLHFWEVDYPAEFRLPASGNFTHFLQAR